MSTDSVSLAIAGSRAGSWSDGARRAARYVIGRLGVFAVLVAAWQLATTSADSPFFPPPSEIAERARELWLSEPASSLFLTPEVGEQVVPSLLRIGAGWGLAVVLGIAVGVAIGRSRVLGEIFEPPFAFIRSLPAPALIPVFMILFGIEARMQVAVIAFGAVWPVLLNTADGVRAVDPYAIDVARSFAVPRRRQIRAIVLPAAAPMIFAGLRVSLSLAVVLMVLSEMVGSANGIGFSIIQAQRSFATTDMWAGMLLLGLLGWGLNLALGVVERRVLAWHAGSKGRLGS